MHPLKVLAFIAAASVALASIADFLHFDSQALIMKLLAISLGSIVIGGLAFHGDHDGDRR